PYPPDLHNPLIREDGQESRVRHPLACLCLGHFAFEAMKHYANVLNQVVSPVLTKKIRRAASNRVPLPFAVEFDQSLIVRLIANARLDERVDVLKRRPVVRLFHGPLYKGPCGFCGSTRQRALRIARCPAASADRQVSRNLTTIGDNQTQRPSANNGRLK